MQGESFDPDVWENMLRCLVEFYRQSVLSELLTSRIKRGFVYNLYRLYSSLFAVTCKCCKSELTRTSLDRYILELHAYFSHLFSKNVDYQCGSYRDETIWRYIDTYRGPVR